MTAPPDWTTLRILVAAVELGSVTRAAERCGIALSAAARRMQELEAAQGVALLERLPRGVRPTPAGEAFVRHARALLDRAARMAEEMRAVATGGSGAVRLAATASAIAGRALAPALAAFAATRPGIAVELSEGLSRPILRDVAEGRADLGLITDGSAVPRGLEATPWQQDRLLAVVAAAHPLAARQSVPFAEVLDHPLIGLLSGGALGLLLEAEAARLGRAPRWRFALATPDGARRLAAAGLGIVIMPDSMALPGLRGVPLADGWARRVLRLVSPPPAELPAPARLLRAHLLAG